MVARLPLQPFTGFFASLGQGLRESLRIQSKVAVLPHQKELVEVIQSSVLDASWIPPR